jgi:hypothetical protein
LSEPSERIEEVPTPIHERMVDSSVILPSPVRPRTDRTGRANKRPNLKFLAIVAAVMVTGLVLRMRGIYIAPMRFDDEGTYVSQAQSLIESRELAPYTYWYDHPPLGWITLAGFFAITPVLEWAPHAIGAGRLVMVAFAALLIALTMILTRRLGGGWAAVIAAGGLLALSPLAVGMHRQVLLDNISVPLLVLAFILALSPSRKLSAALGAGLIFAVSVLMKETMLLFFPFLAWAMWGAFAGPTRRMAKALFFATTFLVLSFYAIFAATRSEFFPREGSVSLIDAIRFQLFERSGSGSIFDSSSFANSVAMDWLIQDPFLPIAGVVSAILMFTLPRTWRAKSVVPIAAAVVFAVIFLFRPGYLPIPYIISLLPFMAILIALLGERVVDRIFSRLRNRTGNVFDQKVATEIVRATLSIVIPVILTLTLVVPYWSARAEWLMEDQDLPYRTAAADIAGRVDKDSVLIVDNVFWTDLRSRGFTRDSLVWYTKLNFDPEVDAQIQGPQDVDFVVSTPIIRTTPERSDKLANIIEQSVEVQRWGSGENLIILLRVRQPEN